MPHNRFYIDEDLTAYPSYILRDTEHHHLAKVMRLSPGETVELVNGKNVLATATIDQVDKRETRLTIISCETEQPHPV